MEDSMTSRNMLAFPTMTHVSRALERHGDLVRRRLFEPLSPLAKWQDDIAENGLDHVINQELGPPADYLVSYLNTGLEAWRSLYLGHMLEQLHVPGYEGGPALALRRKVFAAQRAALVETVAPSIDKEELAEFDKFLSVMYGIVTRENRDSRVARVFFVGDCLLENLTAFLIVPLLERGIELRWEYIVSKTPGEISRELQERAPDSADLVCYSPYSNLYNPVLLQSVNYKKPFMSARSAGTIARDAHQLTRSVLGVLSQQCSCPVSVQNTNNMLPDFQGFKRGMRSLVKRVLSRRGRELAAVEVNRLLDEAIAATNESRPVPLVKVDEVALKTRYGEPALRKRFYDSSKHHPAVLAEKLSPLYVALILANQLLRTKKVVVIDLDETVWRGVIGEGTVEHIRDRQAILKALRLKGILLAIASKNDPKNVHWTGGLLQSADFVAEQISWNPKPESIRRIAEELNLKLKDFVFVDDRADEREMAKSLIPGIEVLDATTDSSWEMLQAWADLMPLPTDGDRTQQYRERGQRESYLTTGNGGFDEKELFATLDLNVDFHVATQKELERVTELINRTNQFNTTAIRTSLRQVRAWAASEDYRILVAQARDKFGAMGIVSAMVIQLMPESAHVLSWVLSCRVFGYGIEMAMLNALGRLSAQSGNLKLQGRIVETAHNQPCRDVFLRGGFQFIDGEWCSDSEVRTPNPEWLRIVFSSGFEKVRAVESA